MGKQSGFPKLVHFFQFLATFLLILNTSIEDSATIVITYHNGNEGKQSSKAIKTGLYIVLSKRPLLCNSDGHIEAENSEAQAKTHPAQYSKNQNLLILGSKKLHDNELWKCTVHIHGRLKSEKKYIAIWTLVTLAIYQPTSTNFQMIFFIFVSSKNWCLLAGKWLCVSLMIWQKGIYYYFYDMFKYFGPKSVGSLN